MKTNAQSAKVAKFVYDSKTTEPYAFNAEYLLGFKDETTTELKKKYLDKKI